MLRPAGALIFQRNALKMPPMTMELCVLASGSSGNASVLRTSAGCMLVDAGLGPRTTARRLADTGVSLADIRAICLTHLDTDHFSPNWFATIAEQNIRLIFHKSLTRAVNRLLKQQGFKPKAFAQYCAAFDNADFEPLPGVTGRAINLAHDKEGSHGFLLQSDGCRLGYATDFGRVPAELISTFAGVDLLAIESNYDPDMQLTSNRPWRLKQRIMGGQGHLSNEQAFEAVQAIFNQTTERYGLDRLPRHVVLLHRSRQCNCPVLVRRIFCSDLRIAQRLVLSHQNERTEWLGMPGRQPLPGEQLTIFDLAG